MNIICAHCSRLFDGDQRARYCGYICKNRASYQRRKARAPSPEQHILLHPVIQDPTIEAHERELARIHAQVRAERASQEASNEIRNVFGLEPITEGRVLTSKTATAAEPIDPDMPLAKDKIKETYLTREQVEAMGLKIPSKKDG